MQLKEQILAAWANRELLKDEKYARCSKGMLLKK